jgi:hypothetical protein
MGESLADLAVRTTQEHRDWLLLAIPVLKASAAALWIGIAFCVGRLCLDGRVRHAHHF